MSGKRAKRARQAERERAAAAERGSRGFWPVLAAAAVGGLAAVALVAALVMGEGRQAAPPVTPTDAEETGPVHVHGLGVNPADGALYIATHSGLWRSPAGSRKAHRVGDSRQDTMGFTVAGPDNFLGSGHPDVEQMREQDLPPHLGLIRSRDGGRNWENVSLLGQADFHVLRASGRRIYGVDASSSRFLVSDDGGSSWQERPTPAALFDLAADSQDPSHLVAVTQEGLLVSRDAGRSWRTAASGPLGLLARHGRAIYIVDQAGTVHVSRDGGTGWRRAGSIGGEPAAFLADGGNLYAALHDGTIVMSRDGGRTFVPRVDA